MIADVDSLQHRGLSQESLSLCGKCVHCGLCISTCPTYILLRDERDSPRGRIYRIKDMLEEQRKPSQADFLHIDRCLSCLSCTTTCPSDVNYMELIDRARIHIYSHRPWWSRSYRELLVFVLTRNWLSRLLISFSWGLKVLKKVPLIGDKFAQMDILLPMWRIHPFASDREGRFSAQGEMRGRVILHRGCVQRTVAGQIHDRAITFLTYQGFEVIVTDGGCCGSLGHHLGQEIKDYAMKDVSLWHESEQKFGKVDAIISTSSGCALTMKHYGSLWNNWEHSREYIEDYSNRVEEFSCFLERVGLRGEPKFSLKGLSVSYQAPCTLQHGHKRGGSVPDILLDTGADFSTPAEAHICCGSAGIYNVLQPVIANKLRERKVENINYLKPDIIVTANVGCMVQIASHEKSAPICHISELLCWSWLGILPFSFGEVEHLSFKIDKNLSYSRSKSLSSEITAGSGD